MRILLLLGLLVAFTVHSDTEFKQMSKNVECANAKRLFSALINEEYQEKLFWMGNDADSKYALLVNSKTKAWTFLQYDGTNACILGVGVDAKQVFTGPEI